MARRLDKTLADYIGIAISPALIMAMVGSLVFFLLEIFYQGRYEGRLQVILALFVMAIVLIGRISIEMGSEQATLYGTALAIVTALAVVRLVDHGWLINIGLLALIWWSAHKLTWDCTLIDEQEDASSEGLLRSTGLNKVLDNEKPSKTAEGPAEPSEPAEPEASSEKQDRGKPHAPGVWIVYFSLAALPLFGLGEMFIRDDPARKRYAFFLLLIYVVSGLGLLLMTSFLGLRRYLRQRRLQMPASMAGIWITTGAAILVALLVLAVLLPRPGTEQSPFKLPIVLRAPDRKASPYAMGNDGAKGKGQPGGQPENAEQQPTSQSGGGSQQQSRQQGAGSQGGQSGQQPGGQQQSSGGQSSGGQSSGNQGQQSNQQSNSAQSSQSQQNSQQGESSGRESQGQQSDQQQQGPSSRDGQRSESQDQSDRESQDDSSRSSGSRQDASNQGERRPAEQNGSKTSESQQDQNSTLSGSSRSSWSMPELSLGLNSGWLLAGLRWILYIVLAVVVLVWLWRSRQQVAAAIAGLIQALRAFWARLFGGRKKDEEKAEEKQVTPPPPTPFAAFTDPFASGTAGRCSPEELVRYTFEAMEAWARERGVTRPPDQTPYEFARCVGARVPSLAQGAQRLAELYNQAAYAPGSLTASQVEPLRRVWQLMQTTGATVTQAADR